MGGIASMKTLRQDAWTADDDKRLADIILRHIREGSTQLAAFEEAAEALGRTSAACGYRWNACVRKQFVEAIDMAKSDRKERREEQSKDDMWHQESIQDEFETEVTWNMVFRFLRQHRHDYQVLQTRLRQLERDTDQVKSEVNRLRKNKAELQQQLRTLSDEHLLMSEDYRMLLSIVDRARKRQQPDPSDPSSSM